MTGCISLLDVVALVEPLHLSVLSFGQRGSSSGSLAKITAIEGYHAGSAALSFLLLFAKENKYCLSVCFFGHRAK